MRSNRFRSRELSKRLFLSEALERRTLLSGTTVSIFTVNTATTTTEVEAPATPVAAKFVVKRDGDLTAALPVTLSLGGTATNGVDYAISPGPYVIPAGVASIVV